MMQNGRTIAVWMNSTVGVEILNQTTPRMAQPTEGKLLRNVRMRRSTTLFKDRRGAHSRGKREREHHRDSDRDDDPPEADCGMVRRCPVGHEAGHRFEDIAAGPGSTKAGRWRAAIHHTAITRTTAPSAISRCGHCAGRAFATRESPVEAALDRAEEDDLGAATKIRMKKMMAKMVSVSNSCRATFEQIADAAIPAKQLGCEHDFPGYAEARP